MTAIPGLSAIDVARSLGGTEHLFSLIDRNRTIQFAMAAQIEGIRVNSRVAHCSANYRNDTR